MQELQEQKNELLTKVQTLKTDLQDWRTKLETQVTTYKKVRSGFVISSNQEHLLLSSADQPAQS